MQYVYQQKKSLTSSNTYFDIDFQTGENDTTTVRVMVNTATPSIRQILVSKCETGSPILLSNLRKSQTGTVFMNQNTVVRDMPPASIMFPFKPLSKSSVTDIKVILDQHSSGMFSISGQVTWLAQENTISNDQTKKQKRVRDAQVRDTTGSISVSIWENHIDEIQDEQFYTLTNCKLKFFYGKKLATTEDTQITVAENQELPPADSTPVPHNIISNPEILNVGVNIYPVCNNKDCKKKVSANPGAKILTCHSCNEAMLVKNCYVEINATFQLEKDNKTITATAFGKVLTSYLGEDVYNYKDRADILTEQLLTMDNVEFHLSHSGKLITQIARNVDSTITKVPISVTSTTTVSTANGDKKDTSSITDLSVTAPPENDDLVTDDDLNDTAIDNILADLS